MWNLIHLLSVEVKSKSTRDIYYSEREKNNMVDRVSGDKYYMFNSYIWIVDEAAANQRGFSEEIDDHMKAVSCQFYFKQNANLKLELYQKKIRLSSWKHVLIYVELLLSSFSGKSARLQEVLKSGFDTHRLAVFVILVGDQAIPFCTSVQEGYRLLYKFGWDWPCKHQMCKAISHTWGYCRRCTQNKASSR